MRIDLAVLADAVTVRDNLINVLGGGLTTIGVFPAAPGLTTPFGPAVGSGGGFMVGVRLILSRGELGRQHVIESKITLADGGELNRMELQLFAPPQAVPEGEEAAFASAYAVALGAVPNLGPYSLDLFGDGVHLKAIPFRVVMAPVQPPGLTPPSGGST
jgi:hypothetical protein